MNSFSDKEYLNLKNDTAEIRNCITRYVGYIITATGFSGVIKYIIEAESTIGNLFLLVITIVVITFLFEVIWYKFKSHNRLVGYMQLLMQETDAILLKQEDDSVINERKYISHYKDYIATMEEKNLKDFFSWEFVMSRLHGSFFGNKDFKEEEDALLSSLSKSRFVFSVSDRLYDKIELDNHDQKFFKNIILKLYPIKKSSYGFKNFLLSFKYLIFENSRIILNQVDIDEKYYVNGWRYPKKITQIGFTSILIVYLYFIYSLTSKFEISSCLCHSDVTSKGVLAFFLFLTATGFLLFWIFKYLRRLPELVYGKFSIDYFCWMFFLYRVQLLNSKGLIPIYFSRSFLRYFKAKMYTKFAKKFKPNFIESFKGIFTEDEIKKYIKKLSSFCEFEKSSKEKLIHQHVIDSFKEFESVKDTLKTKEETNQKINEILKAVAYSPKNIRL